MGAAPHQLPGRELGSRWRGAGGEGSGESLTGSTMIMTPWEDLFFVINNLLLGEEPSIEDFILLVGTSVAFIAFILWCCFPIEPKDSLGGSEHLTTQAADAVYDARHQHIVRCTRGPRRDTKSFGLLFFSNKGTFHTG